MHLTDKPAKRTSKRPFRVNGKSSSYPPDVVQRIGEMVENDIPRKVIVARTGLTNGQVVGILTKHNFRYKNRKRAHKITITMPKASLDKARARAFITGKSISGYLRYLIERDH